MKTLKIYAGMILDTETGYQQITGTHFNSFAADNYTLDDDGNPIKTGVVILTAADIKTKVRDMTGKSYDMVEYQE